MKPKICRKKGRHLHSILFGSTFDIYHPRQRVWFNADAKSEEEMWKPDGWETPGFPKGISRLKEIDTLTKYTMSIEKPHMEPRFSAREKEKVRRILLFGRM